MENNNTVLIISFFKDNEEILRSGKSTKGKEKNHKISTETNLRYSTVYFLKGRVYCGRSQWKRKNAELKKVKLRNLIFQISYVLK